MKFRRNLNRATARALLAGTAALVLGAGCTYDPLDPIDASRDASREAGPDGTAADLSADVTADVAAEAPPADQAVDSPPDSPTCVPAPEQCNGQDDDCDQQVDDGCPVAEALIDTGGARTDSPAFGSLTLDQNLPINHRCPAGQVIAAFTGHSGYAIDTLGAVCATLRVHEDRGATPFRYPLLVEMGESFAPVGGNSGNVNSGTRCPPGFVVTGIGAWPSTPSGTCGANYCSGVKAPSCTSNFGLEIQCSRYEIVGAPGNFRLARIDAQPFRTAARVEVDLGPLGFPTSKMEYACPGMQVAVEVTARYGPWPYDCSKTTINGLRAACAPATVRLR